MANEERAARLIGVMRICDDFAEYCHVAIEAMSRACDGVCFLTDRVADPRVLAAIKACPNLLGTREKSEAKWTHSATMVEAYRFANEFTPDWVVAPDYDELLPSAHLREEIAAAVKLGKECITFPILHCWMTPDTIVDPKLNVQGPHAKIYKAGDAGFEFDPAGFCVPRGYWKRLHASKYPMRHMRMMTPELRARRAQRKRFVDPWAGGEPKTHAYRDMTIQEWKAL